MFHCRLIFIQVLVGFLSITYLVVAIVILYYLIAHDPQKYPFDARPKGTGPPEGWVPNNFDTLVLKSFRKVWRIAFGLFGIGNNSTVLRDWILFSDQLDSVSST